MTIEHLTKGAVNEAGKLLPDDLLKKLQNVLLMELKDIKAICDEKNIKFILIGGSAIGALRHKGFIPWDDDIDIAMTRADYEILANEIRKNYQHKYSVSDAHDKNNHGKNIPKIRLNGTAYRTLFETSLGNCGIRIDIFIIENTFDNAILRNVHGALCLAVKTAVALSRIYHDRKVFLKISNSLFLKLKCIAGFFCSIIPLNSFVRFLDDIHGLCKNQNSKYVTVPSDKNHYFKELEKREDICEVLEVEFEKEKMYLPKNYDGYLKKRYGDYMKLPPEEKRIRSFYLEYDLGKYGGFDA